jgi:exopolysaccharide biosynthesis protein
MKKIFLSCAMALAILSVNAVGKTWNLQGSTYDVDTLYHAVVGPGTTQTSLLVKGDLDLRIFYTTTDVTNPNVEMRVAKAKNMIKATRSVSNLSKDNSVEGAQYFTGVNGDFFDMSNGQPLGTNVLNSEIYNTTTNSNWLELSFDANEKPYLGKLTFSGNITKADGSSYDIAVNTGRGENNLIVFTPRFGTSTGTNQWGIEIVATPVESDATIALGKTVKMKIVGASNTAGNMTIPAGSYVLSGHGNGNTFVSTMKDGDIVELTLNASANGQPINPVWSIGGCPAILSKGVVLETEDASIISHLPSKEPRTAVGYDETGTKVVMLVVDGRSDISDGCRTKILADIMREVGCYEAMNFDGGGSTELYHQKLGIQNVPSGGTERSVTNGLFAVATTPTDNEIAEIRFVDWVKEMPQYGYYTPKFYGYNQYGVLINTDLKGVTLSCSAELGEVVNDGTTLFGNGGGTHALTATYNGISTTLAVSVDDKTEPIFRHPKVMLNGYDDYTVDVYGVVRGADVTIDNVAFTWETSDASVVTVNELGELKGLKNGTAKVKATVGNFSKEIDVTVEIPTVRYQDITSNEGWAIEVSNLSNQSITTLPTGGFAIDYTADAARKIYLTIAKDAQSWSRPDSLLIEINPGTSSWKTLNVNVEDYRSADVVTYEMDPDLTTETMNRLMIPMSAIVDVKDMSTYPLVFKNFYVVLADKKGTSHHIEIKRIAWVYNVIPADASGVEEVVDAPEALVLVPNPVKVGEVVRLGVSSEVDYTVCSLNGAVVAQGCGTEFSTAGFAPGMYVVKAANSVAKLIVK